MSDLTGGISEVISLVNPPQNGFALLESLLGVTSIVTCRVSDDVRPLNYQFDLR